MCSMESTRTLRPAVFFLLCLGLSAICVGVDAGFHEDQLISRFFYEQLYHVSSRPVANESEAIDVKFGLSLQQIIDVNEKNEILVTNIWLKFEWADHKLKWNATENGGVESIRIPSKIVWIPDILLYNTASEAIDSKYPTNVVVSSTGSVSWIPLGIFTSACSIDITWFPFDEQKCPMKFGSWTYDGNKLNLTEMDDPVDLSTYQENGEWDVIGVPASRSVVSYECCPEPYIDITFMVHIRRRTLYYGINLIIPCAMISFLALVLFILPPGEGEKIGLGITILLALSVFQLIVADAVPATSLSTPLIGVYFVTVMVMCTLSVIMTVVVLNLHHRTPDMYAMPNWVRIVFCEWLAWILCIPRPGHELTLKSLLRKRKVRKLQTRKPQSTSLINNVRDVDSMIPPAGQRDAELAAQATDTEGIDAGFWRNNNNSSGVMTNANLKSGDEGHRSQASFGNVTTPTTGGAPSNMSIARSETLAILNELRWLTTKMKNDGDTEQETNDWKFVAMVVDRLCLWFFSTYLIVGTVVIFSRALSLYN